MKKVMVLFMSLLLFAGVFGANNAFANSNLGFYLDNRFEVSVSEFKAKSTSDKRSILMQDYSFLRLGNQMLKSLDILTKNDAEIDQSSMTIRQYEELIGAPIGTGMPNANQVVLNTAGTYGNTTYNGDVTVSAPGVTIKNAVIKGDLIISESVGQGEVYFEGVQVEGQTKVLGGGENSVYFTDTVLASVIVNKNTGTVRVVVSGNSTVQEVYIESGTILQESNLTGTGFTNVTVQEAIRNSTNNVQLLGTFDTVNLRSANVTMTMAGATSIEDLVLSALATVVGNGVIDRLNVGASASGSILTDTRPQSVVLTIGSSIEVNGAQVTESYSNNATAQIVDAYVSSGAINVRLSEAIYNVTAQDFELTAIKNGVPVQITGLVYDAAAQKLFFNPIAASREDYIELTLKASSASNKLSGQVSFPYYNTLGFGGKITDIYGMAAANVTVSVNNGLYTARTDNNGYYFVETGTEGVFEGTISGPGYLSGTILGTVANNASNLSVNETIMRAASSNEWKIMLTWNGLESDVDSHLASQNFHVYYGNPVSNGSNGLQYVDLDWDDTEYYGPETTTIRKFEDGSYYFFVHNFSDSNPLHMSNSKVQVFKGNSVVADYTFDVPQNTADYRYWGVFELVVTGNGSNVELRQLNELTNDVSKWLPANSDYGRYDY